MAKATTYYYDHTQHRQNFTRLLDRPAVLRGGQRAANCCFAPPLKNPRAATAVMPINLRGALAMCLLSNMAVNAFFHKQHISCLILDIYMYACMHLHSAFQQCDFSFTI